MSPERYQQVKRLFHAAMDAAPDRRAAFLDEACGEDAELRAEVESLLATHDGAANFIESPAYAAVNKPGEDESTKIGGPALMGSSTSYEGQRIGPYQVTRELGRGGMGVVYLAVRADDHYRKRVAIKLVQRGMDTDFVIRRFRHERQILASLDHPNIARLLDGGATPGGLPYFVMEYIEGQPIDEYCDRNRLTIPERLGLFRRVCAAVLYAHQNLVVHRDIKPGNILVTSDGTPKLLDFGIAKLLNPELAQEAIAPTLSVMQLMTPGYASPEQARGQAVTTATDVYSLGVTLYELLTGHRPYRIPGHLPHEIARVISEEEPVKPSAVVTREEVITGHDGAVRATITPEAVGKSRGEAPEKLGRRLSGDLDNIVLMSMRKEAHRRYASAGELSEDLRRHLEGLPVLARGDSLKYRAGKFVRRHKAAVAGTAVVALALIGGFISTLWEARVARIERARAERRFNDVRSLANSFMFEFHDAIENLPGSTPAQSLLVKRALQYLDGLAVESSNDPALQRELATAYEKVGDIQGNPYGANLGDVDGALQSYRKALQVRQSLPAAEWETPSARADLARGHDRVGDMLELRQGAKAALEEYRRALSIREPLAAERPEDAEARRDLSRSYENIGMILGKTGDASGAVENLRKAIQINESLGAARPNDPQTRRFLAVLYHKLGVALSGAGLNSEALEKAKLSLSKFQALAEADPENAKARRELALAYNTLGDYCWDGKDYSCALENYRQGFKLRQALSAADPVNQQARRDLAYSYGSVGSALAQLGNSSEALADYRQCVSVLESLSAASPNNSVALNDLARYYAYFGDVWGALGDAPASRARKVERWREARAWYQRSLNLYTEIRSRGLSRGDDAGVIAARAKDIAACDGKLKTLKGESGSAIPPP